MEVTLMEVTGKDINFAPETDKKVVQGFVVGKLLPPELRQVYHDGGKKYGKRIYRLYHFAVDKDKRIFLRVRDKDAAEVVRHMRDKGYMVTVKTKRIDVDEGRSVLYVSLGPIFVKKDTPKGNVYPLPSLKLWVDMVKWNLVRKIEAFEGIKVPLNSFFLKVLKYDRAVFTYGGLKYPVHYCLFTLRGPEVVHRIALQAGLGSRNAQGAGMVWPLGVRRVSSVRSGVK